MGEDVWSGWGWWSFPVKSLKTNARKNERKSKKGHVQDMFKGTKLAPITARHVTIQPIPWSHVEDDHVRRGSWASALSLYVYNNQTNNRN